MRVGFSESDITPKNLPVELSGYGYFLNRMGTSVESPLKASVLTFEDEDGIQAAICGADVISVDQETVSKVSQAVTKLSKGKYADATILINPSHTHSGPASFNFVGAGGYNSEYVDNNLVPGLARNIVDSFNSATEGEIGIARAAVEGLSYNRTGDEFVDNRITSIRADAERLAMGGLHFACHPVVYGKNSTVISSEYPGYARRVFKDRVGTDTELWLSGCYGDIDPLVNKTRKGQTSKADVELLGTEIGLEAADLYSTVITEAGKLCVASTVVEVPINTEFELDPAVEVEVYRESRRLSKEQDLSPLKRWLEAVAPAVNANQSNSTHVPVTLIGVGRVVFAGLGAEVYSQTGVAIEQQHPSVQIVTLGGSNENKGYIPVREEYDREAYAARSSAFIFGRKPLSPNSEIVFREGVEAEIGKIVEALAA